MVIQDIDGAVAASSNFDPSGWLGAFAEAGGGYALASERKLWLVVDHMPADVLTSLMASVIGRPERQEAIRLLIEKRQIGEVAA